MATSKSAVIAHDEFSDDDDEEFPEEETGLFGGRENTFTINGIVVPNVAIAIWFMSVGSFFQVLSIFCRYGWLNYDNLLGEANEKAPGPISVILVYSFILALVVGLGWMFNDLIMKHKWKKG
ncbi:unnamed protein product [Caenorhabditis nigoni]